MFKISTYLALACIGLMVISRPFLSPALYEIISYLQLQALWPWRFDGIPIYKALALISIISFVINFFRKNIQFSIYKERQHWLILSIFLLVILSDYLSPYPDYFAGTRANVVISAFSSIIIMYFVSIGLCNSKSGVLTLLIGLILVTLYYIYWANYAYFNGEWFRFHQGRLEGVKGSQYVDGNVLSIIYIIGMPFLMLSLKYTKKIWFWLLLVPLVFLLWHAIFLFSSRGAFISLSVVTLMSLHFLKSKKLNIFFLISFALAIAYQGGELLDRGSSTISASVSEYSNEPLNPRLVSWSVGLSIAMEYPLLGAGTQRFQTASLDLRPNETPYVAHNTLIALASNIGMPAAGLYILLLYGFFRSSWHYTKLNNNLKQINHYINESCLVAMVGYLVCSLFLDLIVFEGFYYILILYSVNKRGILEQLDKNTDVT